MDQTGNIAVDIISDSSRFTKIFTSDSDLNEYLSTNSFSSYKVRSLKLEDVLILIQEKSA